MSNKKACKVCGATCDEERCWKHKSKKPLKKSPLPKVGKKKDKSSLTKGLEELKEMWDFFKQIWKEIEHKSEVSNTPLKGGILSTYFHHILPKRNFPQAKLDKENIIILTEDEHASVENDMYKYEEVNKRREKLKTKYNIL